MFISKRKLKMGGGGWLVGGGGEGGKEGEGWFVLSKHDKITLFFLSLMGRKCTVS